MPVSATAIVGWLGSLVPACSEPLRGPGADGLKRTVRVRLLPAPIDTGRVGAPTIEKSAAPPIDREFTVKPHTPALPMVSGRSRTLGEVRLSVATPAKSSALKPSVALGAPTVPV